MHVTVLMYHFMAGLMRQDVHKRQDHLQACRTQSSPAMLKKLDVPVNKASRNCKAAELGVDFCDALLSHTIKLLIHAGTP